MNQLIIVKSKIERPINLVWDFWTRTEHIVAWNYTSEDWVCLQAVNNLADGGTFHYLMATKDGNEKLEFSGKYDKIILHQLIEYTTGDGRKVKVIYSDNITYTDIVEVFEAEKTNCLDAQQYGWKSVLNNFKAYAESSSLTLGSY